jgi:hypothetical protein
MSEVLTPPQVDSLISQNGILASLCSQFFGPKAYSVDDISPEELIAYLGTERESVEEKFQELAREWKAAGRSHSLVRNIAMHAAYQQIIGMGKPAIPLILAELEKELDHWFWALEAITGQNPVPEESKGNLEEMARSWLQWGRDHKYVS